MKSLGVTLEISTWTRLARFVATSVYAESNWDFFETMSST